MIPVSTIPQARVYLLSAINSQVASAGLTEPAVEVYDSGPDHETTLDTISIGGAHRTVAPMAMVGSGAQFWREEHYTIDVEIDCFAAGTNSSMEAVVFRAYQLLGLVEVAVRQDPSLGGLVVQAAPGDDQSHPSWDEAHMGGRCMITAQIHVTATL